MNAEPIGTTQRPEPDSDAKPAQAGGVAAEMTAIFGAPPDHDRIAALPKSRAIVPVLARRRRHGIPAALAALATVVIVGVMAAMAWWPRGPEQTPRPATPTREAPIRAFRPVPDRSNEAARSAIAPALPPPRATAPSPHSVASRPMVRAADDRVRGDRQIVSRASASRERRSAPSVGRDSRRCARTSDGASRAWCLRPAMMAADGRLRAAYEGAVARGADRGTLIAYRRAWISAQRHAAKEPDEALHQMRMLAHDLSILGS